MINLDEPQTYHQFDPSEMLRHIHEMPKMCQEAWYNALRFNLSSEYHQVDKVVILGMGASAIAGDFASQLSIFEGGIPIQTCHEYTLPHLDAHTLVVASSYSGNTEETLTTFTESLNKVCPKLAITTGGKLGQLAEENDVPVLSIKYQTPPRAAFGCSFSSLLGILCNLGLLSDKSQDMEEAIQILDELATSINETAPLKSNPAKQLAFSLWGKIAVVYGAGILSAVARRWKTQINENSKTWSFYELLPELNHNSVVGYQFPSELAERIFVVLLCSESIHPRVLARYDLTADILTRAHIGHQLVDARGKTLLSHMLSLTLFGDYVSYYLAMLYEVDPSPNKTIDYLKSRLAEMEWEQSLLDVKRHQ